MRMQSCYFIFFFHWFGGWFVGILVERVGDMEVWELVI